MAKKDQPHSYESKRNQPQEKNKMEPVPEVKKNKKNK